MAESVTKFTKTEIPQHFSSVFYVRMCCLFYCKRIEKRIFDRYEATQKKSKRNKWKQRELKKKKEIKDEKMHFGNFSLKLKEF